MKIEIREIKDKDNDKIKQVLVSVMTEFGVPDHGTALQDEELDSMSDACLLYTSPSPRDS